MTANDTKSQGEDRGGGPKVILQVQTPRGLWSQTEPATASKRPVYQASTKISEVIGDAREVFKFTENDNKYVLLKGAEKLEPQRTLASYHFEANTVLILSVQGGNALNSIEGSVSLETVKRELREAEPFASSAGLVIDTSMLRDDDLRFYVHFHNRTGETFFAEFACTDYPLYPPFIEFTSEDRTVRGLKSFYPAGFHETPCVCMRYSRKAYQALGGPHGDWRLLDWHLATSGGGVIDTLGMIISDLHIKILESTGRMGQ